MKKVLILIVIAMLAVPLFADEAILIDFSLLTADIIPVQNPARNRPEFQQNQHTVMNFADNIGSGFTRDQRGAMLTSLAIENWEVILSSSSRTVTNMANSYTRESPTRAYLRDGIRVEEDITVMGVRVHFPVEPFNSWAMIRPPFEIPAYEFSTVDADGRITRDESANATTRSRFESDSPDMPAYGVVKNVGVIREIKVQYYDLRFPHGLSIMLIDHNGNERTIFMGYLNSNRREGWFELTWRNPAYQQEARNRDMRIVPLYPFNTPFIKFGGFLIQRDAAAAGGDFITYFKDVVVIYDKAVLDDTRDIDDEAIWGIIQSREDARKTWEMERFGQSQVLRYLEQQRMAEELPFGHPDRNPDQQ